LEELSQKLLGAKPLSKPQDDGCGKAAERRKAIRGESGLFE
jgi:hypothetical protein